MPLENPPRPDASFDAGFDATVDAEMDAPIDAGPALVGTLVARSDTYDDLASGVSQSAYTAKATFLEAPGCVREPAGPCTLFRCGDPGTPSGVPNAGTVIIVADGSPATLLPDAASGLYPIASGAAPFWSAPDTTITYQAFGAEVPMFMGTLLAPQPATFALPDPTAGPLAVSLSGFSFIWTGGAADEVLARLVQNPADPAVDPTLTLECTFPFGDGSATIPAEALVAFTAGATGRAALSVQNTGEASGVDPWVISLRARSIGHIVPGRDANVDGIPDALEARGAIAFAP